MPIYEFDFGLIFWQTVIFLGVLLILYWYAWPQILSVIQRREEDINQALQEAQEARQFVERLQERSHKILDQANSKRGKILQEALEMEQEILKKAQQRADKSAQKILEETQCALEGEKQAALKAFKGHVVDLTVQAAGQLLRRELKHKEGQERFLKELIDELDVTTDTHAGSGLCTRTL